MLLLNWFLASRLLFRIKAWRAGLRPSATKKLKSLQKNLKREHEEEYLEACDEKRELEDITPVELQEKKLKITVSNNSSQSQ